MTCHSYKYDTLFVTELAAYNRKFMSSRIIQISIKIRNSDQDTFLS